MSKDSIFLSIERQYAEHLEAWIRALAEICRGIPSAPHVSEQQVEDNLRELWLTAVEKVLSQMKEKKEETNV